MGDVVEEADGDLMGDGVNIAARLEGIARPGAICLSEDAYRQVKGRLDVAASDLGPIQLKNIAEPVRIYSLGLAAGAQTRSGKPTTSAWRPSRQWLAAAAIILALLVIFSRRLAVRRPRARDHGGARNGRASAASFDCRSAL